MQADHTSTLESEPRPEANPAPSQPVVARPDSHASAPRTRLDPAERMLLQAIERRVLWLSTAMIHHANHVRPNLEDLKVGGHQASSASMVSILTALYFHHLRAGDRVSVKPHASPAYHAVQFLLGNLDERYLPTLRALGGLQAYPSRTKDPDPVDFSTGSVGLGAVAPAFAAATARYARMHFGQVTARRFFAIVGDAELDEGNVWEAVAEDALRGLGNMTLIVDLNRQSLDRVVPGIRALQFKGLFAAAGWRVVEAKYGRRLEAVFAHEGGGALRARVDEMSNEEYQSLLRRHGADLRARLTHPNGLGEREDAALAAALHDTPDDALHDVLSNLGGHDFDALLDALDRADAGGESLAPAVIFAYTIKGWGLPFAGDALNHSMLLSADQFKALQSQMGILPGTEWDAFPPHSAEGRYCAAAAERLRDLAGGGAPPVRAEAVPERIDLSYPTRLSTQEALGRVLPKLAEVPDLGARIVTTAPDVATSTHLANWVGKVGVFDPDERPDYQEDVQRMVRWQPNPRGQHIELGISEMNLFLLLGQLGLSHELSGQQLFPIGTVYDPFVCRGLDALIYALYSGSKMIFAGTPAGVSLSPEGGAHQSTVTASLGISLPGLRYYEPAFAREVEWMLLDALKACCDRANGHSTYLRLSTKRIDQSLIEPALSRLGVDELRRQVLAGGYRLFEGRDLAQDATVAPMVQIVATGAMIPEAVEAANRLAREEVVANVIHATSADALFALLRRHRLRRRRDAYADPGLGHLDVLLPRHERRLPIVTVHDASAHSLAFFGSVHGAPVVPLGVDQFGQSGMPSDLYAVAGIGAGDIVAAAYLALDLARDE
jgi:pyruvate dehydrogenase E1 component